MSIILPEIVVARGKKPWKFAIFCHILLLGIKSVSCFPATDHDNNNISENDYSYSAIFCESGGATKDSNTTHSLLDKLKQIRELSPLGKNENENCNAVSVNNYIEKPLEICYTEDCLDSALLLLKSINFSVDPCNDFYEFSCGHWIANNPIPPTSTMWNTYEILRQNVKQKIREILQSPDDPKDPKPVNQAKALYSMCLNEAELESKGVKPLLDILKLHGGWPAVTSADWSATNFDVNQALADSYRLFSKDIILGTVVAINTTNNARRFLFFGKPTTFFLPETVLLNQEKYPSRINSYKTYYVKLAKELAKAAGVSVTESELMLQAENVIQFETRLVRSNESSDKDFDNQYGNATEENEYLKAPELMELDLDVVTRFIFSQGRAPTNLNQYVFSDRDYITNLTIILRSTDASTVASYFAWRLVSIFSPLTTKLMRDLQLDFQKVNFGLAKRESREMACVLPAMGMFGMAVGLKYVDKGFNWDSKASVEQMVEKIIDAFQQLLDEASWLDDSTWKGATKKLLGMKKLVAYPDWIFDHERLERQYKGFEIIPGEYFWTTLRYLTWDANVTLKSLQSILDPNSWTTSPATVNAFYTDTRNAILIPAGIMQPSFYREKGLKSLNYAGIGTSIGHEIAHGFDAAGIRYDPRGNKRNWWTSDALNGFVRKAKCLIQQYSDSETGVGPVSGSLTSNENIGDNAGIREAFFAYRKWITDSNDGKEEPRLPGLENLSPNQQFFLGYANKWCETATAEILDYYRLLEEPHSPSRFRVLLPLKNFQEFSNNWDCPVGSAMNPPPEEKCVLWR